MRRTTSWQAAWLVTGLLACGSADAGTAERVPDPADQDAAAAAADQEPVVGDLVDITVGGIAIQVEIADDDAERQRGLMYRESLEEDHGMLFIYDRETTLAFWMKNTLIPLDIAYLDSDLRIVDIQQMEPQTTETHPSSAPAQYALEMNLGWFERNGVTVGDRIEF
jgi:uncharacterized membrane protein (UPF0127 family)